MSFRGKIDALDFIIDTLGEHEKILNEIVDRLNNILSAKNCNKFSLRDGSSLNKRR